MARDVRELILKRLLAILQTVRGPVGETPTTWRNRNDVSAAQCPALVLLDNREQKRTPTEGKGHKRMPAAVMEMLPQVWIQVKPRSNVKNPEVGEDLSAWRMNVLAAIFRDGELSGLQGENGELEYAGCQTDMEVGSDALGNMILDLTLTYLFDPDDMQ
jgi:hypothetical protein